MTPPPVSNFGRKTRHFGQQVPLKHPFALTAADDVPAVIAHNALPQALRKPALPRDVLDAEVAHIFAETYVQIADKDPRRVDVPL